MSRSTFLATLLMAATSSKNVLAATEEAKFEVGDKVVVDIPITCRHKPEDPLQVLPLGRPIKVKKTKVIQDGNQKENWVFFDIRGCGKWMPARRVSKAPKINSAG